MLKEANTLLKVIIENFSNLLLIDKLLLLLLFGIISLTFFELFYYTIDTICSLVFWKKIKF